MSEINKKLNKDIQKLEKSISILEKSIQKQTSFKRNFLMAMIRGFGSVFGATVIFGLLLALLIQLVRSIDYVPIINNILNSQAIEDVINRFTQL